MIYVIGHSKSLAELFVSGEMELKWPQIKGRDSILKQLFEPNDWINSNSNENCSTTLINLSAEMITMCCRGHKAQHINYSLSAALDKDDVGC